MLAADITARSPLRTLERSLGAGLGRGRVGAVIAHAGVGKTACLVHIGLDALLRGWGVLHLSNESGVSHLRTFYDELFHEMAKATGLENHAAIQLELERRRLLISQPGPSVSIERLRDAAEIATGALNGAPDVLVVEGLDLESDGERSLRGLREIASSLGAEAWISVRAVGDVRGSDGHGLPRPADRLVASLDVVLLLEPRDGHALLRLLKNGDAPVDRSVLLVLDAATLQLLGSQESEPELRHRSGRHFVLHSGGAQGAEAAFGEEAERHRIEEITFSFDGHDNRVRGRGLRLLGEADLRAGDVSLRYVSHRLGRVMPEIPFVRRVLQSIWHQIKPCEQVFVVGEIQQDGTVRGGTGWGAELARRWNKQLNVFDQQRDGWFRWENGAWKPATPIIESRWFAGTGTSRLQPNGRRAIEELFTRSFGSTT